MLCVRCHCLLPFKSKLNSVCIWQAAYKMGTYQPSLLTHFAVTEDMPGRRRKTNDGQQAVGSDAPGPAPAPAGAHGLVATPACSRKPRRSAQPSTGHLPCSARPRKKDEEEPRKKDEEEPLTLSVHRQHQPLSLSGRRTALLLLKVWVRVWRPKGTQSRGTR